MLRTAGLAFASTVLVLASLQDKSRVLFADVVHLGDTPVTTWPAGTPAPVSRELEVAFRASPNRTEQCLVLKQHDVDDPWALEINGKAIHRLRRGKVYREHVYVVPPGTLRAGDNTLRVAPVGEHRDDILVGDIRLVAATLRQHLDLQPLDVAVVDDRERAVPARITITDPAGELVEVYYAESAATAVRKGVVYAKDGHAKVELPRGDYVVWAGRGMEWSAASAPVSVGTAARVALAIRREVETSGYVAADSHIHTLTFSGHGDATLEERLITLAGEGVELAIATDHNHQTDYVPTQRKMGLAEHYKSVTGNEVTTKNGHFNAFPFDPNGPRPPHEVADWVQLVDGIRQKGAKVVVLNHPRWPQIHTGPFGRERFELNRVSGTFGKGPAITFDAMELVNSNTEMRDPLFVFVDWFALLNHGDTVRAVGTSDSHTVGDPVGQGRTYLRSSTDVPTKIDVDEACDAFKRGLSSVAQGIFTEVWVEESVRMGGTATVGGATFRVTLRVASASWVRPERALLYLNGARVAERLVPTTEGMPTDVRLDFEVATPPNDAHCVAIVLGPGVKARHWRSDGTNDYTLGATNPVFIDADKDGAYTAPRATAQAALRRGGTDRKRTIDALRALDDAVVVQALALLHERGGKAAGAEIEALASALGRPAVAAFAASLAR